MQHVIRLRVDGETVKREFATLREMQAWLADDGPARDYPQGYDFLGYSGKREGA
jgi:hypothetical protein